jgi:predicted AlkP superfamily pyrophosphatase or phosphodiesterase
MWQPLDGKINRVVLLLLDSFGWHLFKQEEKELEWFLNEAAVTGKITSVFPSTTVAALSSIWTGFAPSQHGMVGLNIFFPDQAVLGQLLSFSPSFRRFPNSLIEAGVEPENFLDVPGFGQQLAASGIQTYTLKGHNIVDSALSRMLGRGVARENGIVTSADLFVQIRDFLEESAGKPLYINAYWPAIDTLSHIQGPESSSVSAELHTVLNQLKKELFDSLSSEARKGTVLLITGDHGQILAPPSQNLLIEDYPKINDLLLMRSSGEPRTPYLYARQGMRQQLVTFLRENFDTSMVVFESEKAFESGLLGPPPHSPAAIRRVGDVLVAMRQGYVWLYSDELERPNFFKGRHGGMTATEMEVPWLGYKL